MTRTTDSAHNPRRRRTSSSGSGIPNLGCWARQIRDRHQLARPRAAARLHIGVDMLKKIERNQATPSPAVLDQIVTGYDLDRAQERYTRDLARPSVPLPPIEELRTRTATPERRTRLASLDDRGIACAYIDPLWNLVLANDRFTAGLPGIEQFHDNIALWFFHPGSTTPTSEHIVVLWDSAAAYMVATLRGALGRHRDSPRAIALFQDLSGSVTFSSLWDSSVAVAYGCRPNEPVHLRDPVTGEPYSESVQLGCVPATPDLRFCIGYRQPYSGPALP
ncbi:helix-turn-helix domain-containing protein [Nocardia pneumoniae]|uniref:helix-turn-helix domain-containing protein n=1 Tax=Nocardia pneumoniae TaxID=228601 RepID=UPI0003193BE4|nr:helix-turn-helix domain-containing protein [Nocardia pneumoniae]